MEENIFTIGVRKIHSKTKNQDYYMVDYIDKDNIPQTDYINLEEYNKIASKIKPWTKQVGIYGINSYKKAYVKDLK